ncbi:MAG: adenosine kinase [Lentimicrobiaceae bacterium]|nr:adenosine kinase [Lentimicrobiaceae bacterium]
MKKVLGMGNALADILIRLESDAFLAEHSLPKGSMQLVDADFAQRLSLVTNKMARSFASGGSAANTICGLAKLGVPTAFLGKIADDENGTAFGSDMKSHGVDVLLKNSSTTSSGFCTAFISPDGERTFATYLGAALELNADDISDDLFKGCAILHIEGYLLQNHELIRKAIVSAKRLGLEVSLDLASYNVVEENRDFLTELVEKYTDIVFANEEEARAFTGLDAEKSLEYFASKVKTAIVKVGSKGSWLMSGNKKEQVEAYPTQLLDTTGAGDIYASGFLYGYVNGLDLKQCGKIGSFLASKIVETIGPKFSEKQWDELKKEIP